MLLNLRITSGNDLKTKLPQYSAKTMSSSLWTTEANGYLTFCVSVAFLYSVIFCFFNCDFRTKSADFETIVCVTGQHREMLDQVLQIFDIKPNYDLNIMKQGQDLYDVTARVLTGMRDVLNKAKPDVVLVHGDTTTSTAAALAAFYQQIPVGHVEAGLRTHNIYSPWPEEMNRQITGRIATYHFSPTALSKKNLLTEGVQEDKITVTGNTVIDALHIVVDKIKTDGALQQELAGVLEKAGYDTSRLADGKKLVLITGH